MGKEKNMIYIIAQIIGFISFIVSLLAYHRKKKEKIFQTMMIANVLDTDNFIVTPKEIDDVIQIVSDLISGGINMSIN